MTEVQGDRDANDFAIVLVQMAAFIRIRIA